jgi:hypothetical protein
MDAVKKMFEYLQNANGGNKTSLCYDIAAILDLNYDAAYRKISGKVKLSTEELLILADKYNFSIDQVMRGHSTDYFSSPKPIEFQNFQNLIHFIYTTNQYLLQYGKQQNVQGYYLAKDIPLFYFLGGNTLSKFIVYYWFWLNSENKSEIPTFGAFKSPMEVSGISQSISSIYQNMNITEIMHSNTFTNLLAQIRFLYDVNMLSDDDFKHLTEDLMALMRIIKEQAEKGRSMMGSNYELYINDVISMENCSVFSSDSKKCMLQRFGLFNHILIEDHAVVEQQLRFIDIILYNAKNITKINHMDRIAFFNKIEAQINAIL